MRKEVRFYNRKEQARVMFGDSTWGKAKDRSTEAHS